MTIFCDYVSEKESTCLLTLIKKQNKKHPWKIILSQPVHTYLIILFDTLLDVLATHTTFVLYAYFVHWQTNISILLG